MLDYYGSILKSKEDIDNEIIQKFRNNCYESFIIKIIYNLRKENKLNEEYSVSGWNVFHKSSINKIINITINNNLHIEEKKFKFVYCFLKIYNNIDICRLVYEKFKYKYI